MRSGIKIGIKFLVFLFAVLIYFSGVAEFNKPKEILGFMMIVGFALPTVFRK